MVYDKLLDRRDTGDPTSRLCVPRSEYNHCCLKLYGPSNRNCANGTYDIGFDGGTLRYYCGYVGDVLSVFTYITFLLSISFGPECLATVSCVWAPSLALRGPDGLLSAADVRQTLFCFHDGLLITFFFGIVIGTRT